MRQNRNPNDTLNQNSNQLLPFCRAVGKKHGCVSRLCRVESPLQQKKKKNPKQIINPKREKKIPNINQALFTKRGDAETQTQGTR